MIKLVGLSPRLITEDNVEKQFVNTRYLKPLQARGLNTILLTLENPNLEEILMLCDAFLITGGTDIDPSFYNEDNVGLSKNVDARLDTIDQMITLHAVKHKKPLLGICRGHQSINVFLGGSLYQDLEGLNKDHNSVKGDHYITITNNSFLNLDETINVNSYHHQAIKTLAFDLEAIGFYKDSTIELVVHKSLPIFAVQWHPEINSDSKVSKVIFDKFKELIG